MSNTVYQARYNPQLGVQNFYGLPVNYQRTASRPIPSSFVEQPLKVQQQPFYSSSTLMDDTTRSNPLFYQPSPIDNHVKKSGADDGLNLTISLHPSNEYETNTQSYPNRVDHEQVRNSTLNRASTPVVDDTKNSPSTNQLTSLPVPTQKRRVQIVEHNRQTPSVLINDHTQSRISRNSNMTPAYSTRNLTPEVTSSHGKHKPTTVSTQRSESVQGKSSMSHHRRELHEDHRYGNNLSIHDYLYGCAVPDPGLLLTCIV
jgi:hypothetical protein